MQLQTTKQTAEHLRSATEKKPTSRRTEILVNTAMTAGCNAEKMSIWCIRIHHLLFIFGGTLTICSEMPHCEVVKRIGFFGYCNLTGIPFVQNNIKRLVLTENYISELNATSFPVLDSLYFLLVNAQKTEKLTIRNHSFRNLPKLIELDVSYNRMLILDPDALAGMSKLENLLLYYNRLNGSILENDYFKDLKSLEYVDLSSNEITYLKPHPIFYYLHNFHLLQLKHNQISRICEGDLLSFERKFFTVMDLSSNDLSRQDATDWKSCGKPFRNIGFNTLVLGENGLKVEQVESICNSLNGITMMQLKIRNHIMGPGFGHQNFKDPDNSTFAGMKNSNLQILDISKGSIFTLHPYTFANLSDLVLLNLAENKINRIDKDAFYGLLELQHLNLSGNLLGEIYESAFFGIPNVKIILLQQNHIGAIQYGTFQNLENLEFLDLSDNAIKTIAFYDYITYIKFIMLGSNKLRTVDSQSMNTAYLDMTQNNLENLGVLYKLSHSPTLQIIIMKHNRLSYCISDKTMNKSNSLRHLDLSDNMIQLVWEKPQCLDIFHDLPLLEILYLDNNHFILLPGGIFNGLSSLKNLSLSFNSLTFISPGTLPANLEVLDLSNNLLYSPSPDLFTSLHLLDIRRNNFYCDCSLVTFINWIQEEMNTTNATLVGSPNDFYCSFPPELAYELLYNITTDVCDEDLVLVPLKISLFLFTTTIISIFITSTIIYNHFRGAFFGLYKRLINLLLTAQKTGDTPDVYQYDAYLCYSKKDFQWVQSSLLENLDAHYCEKNLFHLCFEERDFVPGEDHIMNIRQAIWNSRKTICIVTKHFLKDGWCVEAFNCAHSRYFTDLKDVLIMVVVGTLSSFELKRYRPIRAFVQRSRYLKWPEDSQDVDWFLGNLSYKILQEQKVKDTDQQVANKPNALELKTVATIS
uniref:Toll-like receptor 5 n=1 Tax=Leptobrachium leishanense TaxID=445787 RepID=A0A8C5MQU4_9ANUR